ncbi:MAG TPA: hypothetical protein VH280_25010 [Verrucomicrobiae bacterium]|jgi:hypothetical protein|nr:hypothetical protein [Verrucomicrobiae bacterium]
MPRWNICNIFHTAFDSHRLWQFEAKGNFKLQREARVGNESAMPANLVAKSWTALWQPKLNVAWLPAGTVFLRVIELPKGPLDETVAMVELQLEKLAPQPVAQIVWTIHALPQATGDVQTVIVVMAARSAVEEFLGHLEGKGFLPDRLDTPMLDQLEAMSGFGDGAWIWAGATADPRSALVAWWYGGVLRGVNFILVPATGDRAANLKNQLSQLTWHGELEGWLTAKVQWHLVADGVAAAEWEALLRKALDEPVQVTPPLGTADLAARTARRVAQSAQNPGVAALLPPDASTRYRDQFRDRLWLHGLYAAGVLYLVYVAFYFGMVQLRGMQYDKVQGQVAALTDSYNNAMQLQGRYAVLQERENLKFAALDCWKVVADNLPEGINLDRFGFGSGDTLAIAGSAPQDQVRPLTDFGGVLQKAKRPDGNAMFKPSEPMGYHMYQNHVDWNLSLHLEQQDALK